MADDDIYFVNAKFIREHEEMQKWIRNLTVGGNATFKNTPGGATIFVGNPPRRTMPGGLATAWFIVSTVSEPGAVYVQAKAWDGENDPGEDDPEVFIRAQQGHEVGQPILAQRIPFMADPEGEGTEEPGDGPVQWLEILILNPIIDIGAVVQTVTAAGKLGVMPAQFGTTS